MIAALALKPVELAGAFILDCIVGDPRWLPHPVRIIGLAIERGEGLVRRLLGSGRIAGLVLCLSIVGSTFLVAYGIAHAVRAYLPGPWASLAMIALCSMTLALNDLLASVGRVLSVINDLPAARSALSMIVGRDTASLDKEGVLRGAFESLAENTSDGVIAPIFYLALGGFPLAMAYKAVNTLDSMVGYKNERYLHFGWASARLDDIVNYIPARLSALLIAAGALIRIGPSSAVSAIKIALRDGRNHTSPNSGFPEAAMAGALGVRLGGASTYGGVVIEKPTIGDPIHPITPERTQRAGVVTAIGSLIGVAAAAVLI